MIKNKQRGNVNSGHYSDLFVFECSRNLYKVEIVWFIMIKKEKIMSLLGVILGINLIKLVSAIEPSYYVEAGLDFFKNNYGPFFAAIIGTDSFDEFLFAKILVLFLIFAVVWMVLQKSDIFKSNRPVIFIVSLIVSILAVRFMGENEFLVGVLLPYGVLGGAIMVFLPLLIYFLFVENSVPGTTMKRVAWIIYGVIFVVLLIMRTRSGEMSQATQWIYWAGLIFVLINVLFAGVINSYMDRLGMMRAIGDINARSKSDALHELREATIRNDEESTPFNKRRLKRAIRRAQNAGVANRI